MLRAPKGNIINGYQKKVGKGRKIRYFVPEDVRNYIQTNKLYLTSEEGGGHINADGPYECFGNTKSVKKEADRAQIFAYSRCPVHKCVVGDALRCRYE